MNFNEKMTAIADNIRAKTLGTEALTLDDMAIGVNEVYEAGRTKEWSDFWDDYQDKGNRASYEYTFSYTWNNEIFRPKWDIKPTSAFSYAFMSAKIKGNMKEMLENLGVKIDTSRATYMNHAFNNAWDITHLPAMSFENITNEARIQGTFMGCYSLQYIEKVIYPETLYLATTNTFQSCKQLAHLRIGGKIGKNFNVSWCPLDTESVIDIILHLVDYKETENAGIYSLALKDECKTAMANLGAIPELNNKTYTEYLADIGWVLA